ncbi:amino acid ABC transporter permease [Mesorhizobium sp.]|uniref:amino acid ABC transporter permease n=1 Tax=Mesorhizobium sp. TaxID=1871066 RepID=UPI000FE91627|nr:amino acid ABC transporter permease [Mesorhizobium sp.]RWK43143.1 MAG: amino acid ABC transporter permease [Mesorhizobium sp.]RWK71334.1 MAG: amino acid ABC transporter permease [Mesorhizobium sp.]RWK77749.1 MAG: amino acid ABC transporter permease [Mesorhizobium sp.]RWK83484.1 MAG: amino acid ABC transporter permease [Mesorhizobium sp.]RWL07161.1 MAG: amino acid ABC transporter permease [Mesorhizobium sp.]
MAGPISSLGRAETAQALASPAAWKPSAISTGLLGWLRTHLFYSWFSTLVTIGLAYLTLKAATGILDWALLNAVWTVPHDATGAQTQVCRNTSGACWAVVGEKHRYILFGTYPFEEQWRPALCIVIFISLYFLSGWRRFWNKTLPFIWIAGIVAVGTIMWGGVFGLSYVPQERWGGLVITLILATFGLAFAFPFAILVALGRRSEMPAIKWLCIGYVELIRGVPLISLLFMASVMLPLFLPEGVSLDKLLRAQIAVTLFAGAYLAEVVRGGLQSLPKGQYEAADALGLGYWRKIYLIVLPQALTTVIPPLVNTFIGFFKDTSLVLIVGIFDFLATSKTAVLEPAWQGFSIEVYVFCGMVYFCFCFAMSRYSQRLEVRLRREHASG